MSISNSQIPLLCLYGRVNSVQEAIRYYEPIVKKQGNAILDIPAIVLANLCVSHIMISQNEEAEELMRKVCGIDLRTVPVLEHVR